MKKSATLLFIFCLLIFTIVRASDRIPGDINGDGNVNFSDFLILAENYGSSGPIPLPDPPDTVYAIVRDTVTVAQRDTIDRIVEVTQFDTVRITLRDTVKIPQLDTLIQTLRDTVRISVDLSERPEVKSSWSEVVKEVEGSIYWVGITVEPTMLDPEPTLMFLGTAFAIDVDAIATNAHVAYTVIQIMKGLVDLGLNPSPFIIQARKRAFFEGTYRLLKTPDNTNLVGFVHPLYDFTTVSPDVGILIIDPSGPKLPQWLKLTPTKQAKALNTGDEIATLGFPGELEQNVARFTQRIPTLKTGIVSALRPYKDITPSHRITNRLVQHNFDTTPGTSGSPIFNLRGEVVAINHAVSQSQQGSLGFGIRADELRELIEAIQFEYGVEPENAKPALTETHSLGQIVAYRGFRFSVKR